MRRNVQVNLRRFASIVVGLCGLPGLALSVVTAYAFFILPATFGLGVAAGRSPLTVGVSLGLFCSLVIAFVFGLGYAWETEGLWFYALCGASILLLLLATFKIGTEARLRLFRPSPEATSDT